MTFLMQNARWLATGLLLTYASSFGQTWFISLFAGEIREAHGLTNGQWGSLYTVATLSSAALLFSRGALVDTMPLSRLAPGIALLFAAGTLLMAVAPTIWLLGIGVFMLRFCGQGMFSHMAVTSMGRWFHAARGRAVAIAGLGHPLGEATLSLIFVALIAGIGWRQSWGIAAAVLALIVVPLLAWLLAQDRVPAGATEHQAGAGLHGRHWTRSDVLRHWLFPALLPLFLTPSFIGTVIFFQQVHVAEVKGWTLAEMAPGYVAWAGLSILAGLAGGWLCDRFGPERLLPGILVPMGLASILLGWVGTPLGWIAVLSVMALTQGANQSLLGALLPRVYGTRHLGAVRALQTVIMVISTAVGPGVTGLLIDAGIDYPAQSVVLGIWCLCLSLALIGVMLKVRRELESSGV